jgi:YHS domain-containing protein
LVKYPLEAVDSMKHAILTAVLLFILSSGALAFSQSGGAERDDRARDPVCKIMVKKDPELSVKIGETTYYFCMKKDMVAFQKNPEKYLKGDNHAHPDPNS